MRGLTMTVFAVALAGCGLAQQAQFQEARMNAEAELHRRSAECKKSYPDLTKGTARDAIRCMNVAHAKSGMLNGAVDRDLVELAGLKAEEEAAKFDAGKITRSQLDLELARINSEYQTASQARVNAANMTLATQQQAAAAQQRAAMQQVLTGAAIMSAGTPPHPTQTNCSTFGRQTNCTTW